MSGKVSAESRRCSAAHRGAGKSLSAEVIASALGYPLSESIWPASSARGGGTEKHLNRLFDAVEEAPCVLLFDEADALFGKRADVKGARTASRTSR